jgi:hypothetical protein
MHLAPCEFFEVNSLQGFCYSAQSVRFWDPSLLQTERNIFFDCEVRPQRIVLEDHRGITAMWRNLGHILIVEKDSTRIRLIKSCDVSQQRCLAATAWPQQKEKFARLDNEVYGIEGDRVTEFL